VPRFLSGLRTYGTVTHAAEAAGIGRRTAYDRREKVQAFANLWDDAQLGATEDLELSVFQKAKDGWQQEVYFQGEQCGTRTMFAPQLATFMLSSRKPEMYNRPSHDALAVAAAQQQDSHEVQFFPDPDAAKKAAESKGEE